jgi:hypothetical protein
MDDTGLVSADSTTNSAKETTNLHTLWPPIKEAVRLRCDDEMNL